MPQHRVLKKIQISNSIAAMIVKWAETGHGQCKSKVVDNSKRHVTSPESVRQFGKSMIRICRCEKNETSSDEHQNCRIGWWGLLVGVARWVVGGEKWVAGLWNLVIAGLFGYFGGWLVFP